MASRDGYSICGPKVQRKKWLFQPWVCWALGVVSGQICLRLEELGGKAVDTEHGLSTIAKGLTASQRVPDVLVPQTARGEPKRLRSGSVAS
mmetsp:Transcript_17669/g.41007  ORF Transcript_17669/g.41007 Transcript_17669/m.41007 type:complete len:91 (-) Transcript_17669:266-538(-)